LLGALQLSLLFPSSPFLNSPQFTAPDLAFLTMDIMLEKSLGRTDL
jgi:hypothetical protein